MPTHTFLHPSNGKKLQKTINAAGIIPYPFVKNMTSTTYEFPLSMDGLRDKVAVTKQHAVAGDALLKGNLIRPIEDESRANMTDNDAPTQNVVIDIDGLTVEQSVTGEAPYTRKDLERVSEHIISLLPGLFHDVCYIVHASSSMGRKPGKVSLHLDFWLRTPICSKALKNYLTLLNLDTPAFADQLTLSATGASLRFPLDRSLADNSRLIYIAPPLFKGEAQDPIPEQEDRIFLVEKSKLYLDMREALSEMKVTRVKSRTNTAISRLRLREGLPDKHEKTKAVTFGDSTIQVVTNPDAVEMEFLRDNDQFVYYNIHRNGHRGDSNAYYVRKDAPKIVFNFKGESNFLFEQACPTAYRDFMERFPQEAAAAEMHIRPFVFRDLEADAYFNALINTNDNSVVCCFPAQRGALSDWCAQNGSSLPEIIETWDYKFRPNDPRQYDERSRFINKFQPTEYMTSPSIITGRKVPKESGLDLLRDHCPVSFMLMEHLVGNDDQCFVHFLHWLACIFQHRIKTQNAWIMHGIQGTGKGALFHSIITPLLGTKHTKILKLRNLDEQYNAWVETALLTVIDEFKLADSVKANRLFSEIKNMITEPVLPVRAMQQNLRNVENYMNVLFYSNEFEIIPLPEDDRRFNVCPRQETPILKLHPNIRQLIRYDLPKELYDFAGVLSEIQVDLDLAMEPLQNNAKKDLSAISRTTLDQFVEALNHGDFDFFSPVLDMSNMLNDNWIHSAKSTVKRWLLGNPNKIAAVWTAELLPVYNVLVGRCETEKKLGRILALRGKETTQIKKDGLNRFGIRIQWKFISNSHEDLCREYLSTDEKARSEYPPIQAMARKESTTH